MKHIVFYSSGIGSWAAAKRVAENHGTEDIILLFSDTLIEDKDNYRFLIESSCNVFGLELSSKIKELMDKTRDLPPPIVGAQVEQRKVALWQIANEARFLIPGLTWLQYGMTPFEIFKKERFFGTNQVAPCSKILKRETAEAWVKANAKPEDTTLYFGMYWWEAHRTERNQKAWSPYPVSSPLQDAPYLDKPELLGMAKRQGLEPPELYKYGVPNANCGGGCVRAGQARWAHLLKVLPNEYLRWEKEEELFSEFIGRKVTILSRSEKGEKRQLPLSELREKIQTDPQLDLFDDWGGCGCFVDESA